MAFYVIKGRKEVLLQYCLRIHHTWALCFCRLISQITENFSPLYVISTFLSKRRALTFLPCFLLIGTQQCIGKRECKHPGRFGLLWTLEPAIQILFESLSLRLKAFTLSSGPKERAQGRPHSRLSALFEAPSSFVTLFDSLQRHETTFKGHFQRHLWTLEWSEFPRTSSSPKFWGVSATIQLFLMVQCRTILTIYYKGGMRRLRAMPSKWWMVGWFYLNERKKGRKPEEWKETFVRTVMSEYSCSSARQLSFRLQKSLASVENIWRLFKKLWKMSAGKFCRMGPIIPLPFSRVQALLGVACQKRRRQCLPGLIEFPATLH